jgi:hypothetical protein
MSSTRRRSGWKPHPAAWPLLWLSLICCVFEGALRKWGVGDTSVTGRLAYLSKDICLAGFLLLGSGHSSWLSRVARPYLQIGLGLLALGAMASALSGVEPVGVALSIRTFFVLPLASWIAGRLLPADAVERMARWLAMLALPMAFLGTIQFYSPSGSAINRYSTEGEYITTSGVGARAEEQRVRATGTFSYISGFGEFGPMAVWGGIVTFVTARSLRQRWLGYAGLVAGLCCAFVTVSRSAALVSLALVAIWAGVGGRLGRKAQALLTIGGFAVVLLLLTGQWNAADEVVGTTYARHVAAKDDTVAHRTWYQFVFPLHAIEIAPLGAGLGSQQVATSLGDNARRPIGLFESAWGRIVLELGVAGLFGFLVTLGVAFAPLRIAYRSCQGEAKIIVAITGGAALARAVVGFQFNHVGAYFFWAMAAAFLALGNAAQPQHAPGTVHARNTL